MLFLCGMPAAGKTTFAKRLGETRNLPWTDTDALLEKKKGETCLELYRQHGDEAFRLLEREILETLSPSQHSIVALGGGTTTHPDNFALVKERGTLIYLRVPPLILLSRLFQRIPFHSTLDAAVPLLSFAQLYRKRDPLFSQQADSILESPDCEINLNLPYSAHGQ